MAADRGADFPGDRADVDAAVIAERDQAARILGQLLPHWRRASIWRMRAVVPSTRRPGRFSQAHSVQRRSVSPLRILAPSRPAASVGRRPLR